MPKEIKYKTYSDSVRVPLHATSGSVGYHATSGSAGYDLSSAENKKIQPFKLELIETDLQIEIPDGFYGKVVGRSGLALKHNVVTNTGTIDSDFRGVVCVILINLSRTEYEVDYGETIQQIIFAKYKSVKFVEAKSDEMLTILLNRLV